MRIGRGSGSGVVGEVRLCVARHDMCHSRIDTTTSLLYTYSRISRTQSSSLESRPGGCFTTASLARKSIHGQAVNGREMLANELADFFPAAHRRFSTTFPNQRYPNLQHCDSQRHGCNGASRRRAKLLYDGVDDARK